VSPECSSAPARSAREVKLTTLHRTVMQALSQVDEWIGEHGAPGVGAAVWSGGEIVAERYAGEGRAGVPVTHETLFPLASVTKPVAAATLMTLVDDGIISLDEPVGRLLPEFRAGPAPGVEGVEPALERLRPTISARQLLCHVSGLPEDLGPREARYREEATIETIIDEMCQLPLQSAPGEELRYSNAGYGVVARLTTQVSGQPFWQTARNRVLEPLGIRDIVADPTGPALERVAHLTDTSHPETSFETYNSAYWRGLALPWGGLFGTPRDTVRFAAAFLPSGERFLSETATSLMTTDQTLGVPGGVESAKVRWNPGRWGLGWEVKGEKRRHWSGDFTSPSTFCHFGHAGTLLWGDPERDIALAVFANRTVTHMWGFILPRWARLSNAVIAAAETTAS
jgi:CubicO group peptidase (beta-lactamase class C family)